VNTVTPRIFVAATEQNDGKTTTCVGLFAALRKRLGRIGYIKPVGQRFVRVDGMSIDEDTVLIDTTYRVHTPLEAMSPIAVEPDFTRRYIETSNHDQLVRKIRTAFDRAAWEKDFVIIEGSGHAGVGSVFDLSNAGVAATLHSKVILVTRGGIGRPVDEIALNKALFDKAGVEVIGAIVNKVLPSKYPLVSEFAGKGLARIGVELLGCIPEEPKLTKPSLGIIRKSIKGKFIGENNRGDAPVHHVVIGGLSSGKAARILAPGTLVVTPGDREDLILAALAASGKDAGRGLAGVIISDGDEADPEILETIQRAGVPVISSPLDAYAIACAIHSMTVKTLPGEYEKIDAIQAMIERHVNVDRLLQRLTSA
jgi:hypothetical protein